MRRFRAPSSGLDKFFAAQFSAGHITSMSGFDLRQAQGQMARPFTPFDAYPDALACDGTAIGKWTNLGNALTQINRLVRPWQAKVLPSVDHPLSGVWSVGRQIAFINVNHRIFVFGTLDAGIGCHPHHHLNFASSTSNSSVN